MKQQRPKLVILADSIAPSSDIARSLAKCFDLQFKNGTGSDADDAAPRPGDLVLAQSGTELLAIDTTLVDRHPELVLQSIGEGLCVCNAHGFVTWSNRKFLSYPVSVQKRVEMNCKDALRLFAEDEASASGSCRRFSFQSGDEVFLEMIASLVIDPDRGPSDESKIVAIIWDNTRGHKLQQRLDAIDSAGSELVRIESAAVASLNTAQRLALLEEKIIRYTRDLMEFDHFNIYLLDKPANRLMPVMTVGMPEAVTDYELYASTSGSGISGHVAATGKSYICHDVQNDPHYLDGLEAAASSLSVPLMLHDEVIGVFNIESIEPRNFTEDDRQIAEIFGRYVALALNILDLLLVERCTTSGTVAVNVIGEISHPLNDIVAAATAAREQAIADPQLLAHLDRVLSLVETVRGKVEDVAKGPRNILGVREILQREGVDPALVGRHILVADDESAIRDTIYAVLTKRGAVVTVAGDGQEAIDQIINGAPGDIDLVLSDISMPDRNGYEVFAAARKVDAHIPVILMTGFGYDPHHSIVRASQEGLQCVLFKPFQVEQLISEVCKAFAPSS